jgi:hypothetical protein
MGEENAEVQELSEDEAEAILDGTDGEGDKHSPIEDPDKKPDWAVLPENLKMPKPGVKVCFMRFPAAWTTDPTKGDRWCVCWPISEVEERLAYQRARGDSLRSVSELAKQTIRVVDGYKANWSGDGKPGQVLEFCSAIGPKGRQMLRNYYVRTHTCQDDEILDFFSKHFVNMTVI